MRLVLVPQRVYVLPWRYFVHEFLTQNISNIDTELHDKACQIPAAAITRTPSHPGLLRKRGTHFDQHQQSHGYHHKKDGRWRKRRSATTWLEVCCNRLGQTLFDLFYRYLCLGYLCYHLLCAADCCLSKCRCEIGLRCQRFDRYGYGGIRCLWGGIRWDSGSAARH